MAWYVWLMIGLIVLTYCQYTMPEKTNSFIKPVYGKVHDFLSSQTSKVTNKATGTVCPDVSEPVCAGGITYSNSCLAALAGKTEVTPGAC